MARFGTNSLRRRPACRFVAWLALLLFVLRAAIPDGYMPDLDALEHGEVRVIICTGTGTQALLVDEAGQPIDDTGTPKPHAAAADCALGIATIAALALPDAPAAPPRRTDVAPPPGAGESRTLRALPQGPPLGPRAPPSRLG